MVFRWLLLIYKHLVSHFCNHIIELPYDVNELSGQAMYFNQGKFRQNGGCGYILKPKVMRDPDERGIGTVMNHSTFVINYFFIGHVMQYILQT